MKTKKYYQITIILLHPAITSNLMKLRGEWVELLLTLVFRFGLALQFILFLYYFWIIFGSIAILVLIYGLCKEWGAGGAIIDAEIGDGFYKTVNALFSTAGN